MNNKTVSVIVIALILAGPFIAKAVRLDEINFISALYYSLLIIFGALMLRNFKPRPGIFWICLAGLFVFALGLVFYYLF